MKIFSAGQLKEWDNYTISHEPVTSNQLMERAARACYQWIAANFADRNFKIFCGKGNNGGDGLAIAAMLIESKYNVSVFIAESGSPGSKDFQINLARLNNDADVIHSLQTQENFPAINSDDIIIDAIFGTGLNKPPGGLEGQLIEHLNQPAALIISVDIPSGLYADKSSKENMVVKADYTLTFQQCKRAFLLAENEEYFGRIVLLDINLHQEYYQQQDAQYELINAGMVKAIFKPRKTFSNKGDFGHACLMAGSYEMMGAAVLASKACLKTGAGKLTSVACKKGYEIMQISVPEAMCKVYGNTYIRDFKDHQNFKAVGIGPGIGLHTSHTELLQSLFKDCNAPMVIDADALNTIADNKKLLSFLPQNCIITPHPKEFDRLFGKSKNDFERMESALKRSEDHKIYIVLKGHHTLITTPDNKGYFNSTGNAGMAKGGSGDVLTGMLTALLAQGYSSLEACLLGVYLHGLAGDIAAEKFSQQAMMATDIIDCLGEAFKKFEK